MYKDYIKVLNVDLGTGKIRIDKRDDLKAYLGGVGVGIKLLEENVKPNWIRWIRHNRSYWLSVQLLLYFQLSLKLWHFSDLRLQVNWVKVMPVDVWPCPC